MITRKIFVDIDDLTIKELANEICDLYAEDQVALINEIASISKTWCVGQLCSMSKSPTQLTTDGSMFLEMLNEYMIKK